MSRLEEIQNEIGTQKGFEDFDHLLENTHEMEIIKAYFNKASIQYAREVAIASLEKASENARLESVDFRYQVDKEAITDNDNIVIL